MKSLKEIMTRWLKNEIEEASVYGRMAARSFLGIYIDGGIFHSKYI